jgi:uncharacterized phage-associated protein
MTVDALAVANEFIDLAVKRGEKLTPMKLQKLVYYAHGWWLGRKGVPLLDEAVQAWSYGPVIRTIYNAFRHCGADEIEGKGIDWIQPDGGDWRKVKFVTPSLDDGRLEPKAAAELRSFLAAVYDIYGAYSAAQLSALTHAPGSPWDQVKKAYEPAPIPKYETIPTEAIKGFFRGKEYTIAVRVPT